MKKLNLGSYTSMISGKRKDVVLVYPKQDAIIDLIVGGSLIVMGILLPMAFRNTYFRGAIAADKATTDVLTDIDCINCIK